MDFKTARKKLEEGTNMNFSRWTGKMVARHLYEAGKARLQGKSYEFPGYYLFPIELYTYVFIFTKVFVSDLNSSQSIFVSKLRDFA